MPSPQIRRTVLEPLPPAVVGIALAHVLLGAVIWILLPLLREKTGSALVTPPLVWRGPGDFLPPVANPAPEVATQHPTPEKPVEQPPLPATTTAPAPDPPSFADRTGVWRSEVTPAPAPSTPSDLTGMKGYEAALALSQIPLIAHGIGVSPPTAASAIPGITSPAAVARAESVVEMTGADKYITLSPLTSQITAPAAMPLVPKTGLGLLDMALLNDRSLATPEQPPSSLVIDMGAVETALQQALLKEWKAPAIQQVPPDQRRATLEMHVLRDGSVEVARLLRPSGSKALDASITAAAARVTKIPVTLPSSFVKERYHLRVNFQIE